MTLSDTFRIENKGTSSLRSAKGASEEQKVPRSQKGYSKVGANHEGVTGGSSGGHEWLTRDVPWFAPFWVTWVLLLRLDFCGSR